MAVKRKTYRFRKGDVIEVEEFHDGRYGAPGCRRREKRKVTVEQMQYVNAQNKAKRCRHRLLEYFNPGDMFITWTYEKKMRPETMKEALKDFQKAIRYIKTQYKKRDTELFWIRNIERGTRGAWHIHLIVNKIEDTASILQKAWKKGGAFIEELRFHNRYDHDFHKMARYMTKDQNTREKKQDGGYAKPRLRESSYSTSRNMPLPEPKVDKLIRWKKEPKEKKGYYMAKIVEGTNPITSYAYRRYTMIRLDRRKDARSENIRKC